MFLPKEPFFALLLILFLRYCAILFIYCGVPLLCDSVVVRLCSVLVMRKLVSRILVKFYCQFSMQNRVFGQGFVVLTPCWVY